VAVAPLGVVVFLASLVVVVFQGVGVEEEWLRGVRPGRRCGLSPFTLLRPGYDLDQCGDLGLFLAPPVPPI
jgi:hypothetical protein